MPPTPDSELETVYRAIMAEDCDGLRIGKVLRNTIDQLLDGQHTGRYLWSQLYKTEKTHAGTLVEINLQREFKFKDGNNLDYSIGGLDVDCKYSQTKNGWMIPPEAQGHICLVIWASDNESKWSAGLVRASMQHLSTGQNRDQKKTLNSSGRQSIRWLFQDLPLPSNIFLQLSEEQIKEVFAQKSGQKRVNKLFFHAQGKIVGRAAVATAAQQDDFMKRVRENGGAREKLRPLGITILGHEHRSLAQALMLDAIPKKGEFVSVKLVKVPSSSLRPKVVIRGKAWAVARNEESIFPAPRLPRARPDDKN